ncbi:hypothetical protein [Niveispirillum sp. KHB5.9]|uniref:hypothetical protein n=1 Tax=Niveispirillum sp. KHB5.9 TaxID=3400269 RepID=UPI003A88C026
MSLSIAVGSGGSVSGETLSVTIAGIPAGASLSAGTINLSVTATASVGGNSVSNSGNLAVTVAPIADAPTLTLAPATGLEDQPVALSIAASLTTPASGEVLSVTVSGVPVGANLSAGTNNGNGTWTLTSAQLSGLTLTPPSDYSGTINLSVTVTASVADTSVATSGSLAVTVAPVADAPVLTLAPATGAEDQAIALSIAAGLHSPAAGEILSVTVSGVPAGASLSAGTNNHDGTWTLTGAQLSGLKLTPPADYSGIIDLTVTATASVAGTSVSTSGHLAVTVAPVADLPTLVVLPAIGLEDQPIGLSVAANLVGAAVGEVLSVTVSGVPVGASLSAGTNNHDGSWTLTSAQLSGLKLTPPADFSGSLNLTVTATAGVDSTFARLAATCRSRSPPWRMHRPWPCCRPRVWRISPSP